MKYVKIYTMTGNQYKDERYITETIQAEEKTDFNGYGYNTKLVNISNIGENKIILVFETNISEDDDSF